MIIFGQYKEKLKGKEGRKAWVKFRKNYEDLERSCVNKKYKIDNKILNIQTENGFSFNFIFQEKTPLLR